MCVFVAGAEKASRLDNGGSGGGGRSKWSIDKSGRG